MVRFSPEIRKVNVYIGLDWSPAKVEDFPVYVS